MLGNPAALQEKQGDDHPVKIELAHENNYKQKNTPTAWLECFKFWRFLDSSFIHCSKAMNEVDCQPQ